MPMQYFMLSGQLLTGPDFEYLRKRAWPPTRAALARCFQQRDSSRPQIPKPNTKHACGYGRLRCRLNTPMKSEPDLAICGWYQAYAPKCFQLLLGKSANALRTSQQLAEGYVLHLTVGTALATRFAEWTSCTCKCLLPWWGSNHLAGSVNWGVLFVAIWGLHLRPCFLELLGMPEMLCAAFCEGKGSLLVGRCISNHQGTRSM